jgi:hypothetical protein
MATLIKTMFPKIFVRWDQTINDVSNIVYQNENVKIVAPQWVKEGLSKLSQHIPPGTQFDIYDNNGKQESLIIEGELSLIHLTMLARNEPHNTSGLIHFKNYEPAINDKSVIYALKDLVRQCVIVGKDETTHFGGYPRNKPVKQSENIYLADLIGLQFQDKCNTGRLVLIADNLPKGVLDDFIFKNVVGEKKKLYEEVCEEVYNKASSRFIKYEDVYFDTVAYKKFVANDVLITGLALNEIANEELNFKFLKYGTGFFAGRYLLRQILNQHINKGIANGLDLLFSSKNQKWIKAVELPFYDKDQDIINICEKHGIECKFSTDDALKRTHPSFVTATTNCADPHAMAGNEMGYSSVDASIAENLKSKANIFSPLINKLIGEKFLIISSE